MLVNGLICFSIGFWWSYKICIGIMKKKVPEMVSEIMTAYKSSVSVN